MAGEIGVGSGVTIVDEAVHELRPLHTELAIRGFNVTVCRTAAECIDLLAGAQGANLYIVDVMLLSDGAFTREETDSDMFTGLLLARVIREVLPAVPIVFFTAMVAQDGVRRICDTATALGNCGYVPKHSVLSPFDFGEYVTRILDAGKIPNAKTGTPGKLVDSLKLEPNFFGIGLDVKKLVRAFRDKK